MGVSEGFGELSDRTTVPVEQLEVTRACVNQRLKTITALSLPIIGGMISQNVLNLVDTWMVGSLGDSALAAVSTASFLNFACIAVITGLSAGVQAMAARRVGEGRVNEAAQALHEGLLIAVGVGLPASALLILAAPWLYPLVNSDPAVVQEAVPYLQARLTAMVAVGMNFSFRGFWNGISRPGLYMSTLVVMHAANIAISYCLIFGEFGLPELGALGAGVGTAISTWLGTLVYLGLGVSYARDLGFLKAGVSAETLRALIKLAAPSSLQQLLFAMGFNVLFAIISLLGTTEVAAAGVLMNLSLVAVLPGLALGMSASTLVGQALGRGERDDAEAWGWDVVKVGLVILGGLGIPMALIPSLLLEPFLPGRPETIALAAGPLQVVGVTLALDAVGMVLMQALLGAGAARFVAAWSVGLQWGLFLPAAWLVGDVMGAGLMGIWIVQAGQRAIQAWIFARAWRAGWWKSIKL